MRNNNEGSHEGKQRERGRGGELLRSDGRKGPLSENDFVELTDLDCGEEQRGRREKKLGNWSGHLLYGL